MVKPMVPTILWGILVQLLACVIFGVVVACVVILSYTAWGTIFFLEEVPRIDKVAEFKAWFHENCSVEKLNEFHAKRERILFEKMEMAEKKYNRDLLLDRTVMVTCVVVVIWMLYYNL